MTAKEVSQRFCIPMEVLNIYEKWDSHKDSAHPSSNTENGFEYNENDIRQLSVVMTLYDLGFTESEIRKYMQPSSDKTAAEEERLTMIKNRRDTLLEEIHQKEKLLAHLDYLRFTVSHTKKHI